MCDYQNKTKHLSRENDELRSSLGAYAETQDELTAELGDLKDKYRCGAVRASQRLRETSRCGNLPADNEKVLFRVPGRSWTCCGTRRRSSRGAAAGPPGSRAATPEPGPTRSGGCSRAAMETATDSEAGLTDGDFPLKISHY